MCFDHTTSHDSYIVSTGMGLAKKLMLTKFRTLLLQLICSGTILHFAPLHGYEMNHLLIVYKRMEHINLLGSLALICHYTCNLMFFMNVLLCILIAYFECCRELHWCMFCIIWQINVLYSYPFYLYSLGKPTLSVKHGKVNTPTKIYEM